MWYFSRLVMQSNVVPLNFEMHSYIAPLYSPVFLNRNPNVIGSFSS